MHGMSLLELRIFVHLYKLANRPGPYVYTNSFQNPESAICERDMKIMMCSTVEL